MLERLITERNLPDLMTMKDGSPVSCAGQWPARRRELLALLSDQLFGVTPKAPACVECAEMKSDANAFAGKAIREDIRLRFDTPGGDFSFPVTLVLPKTGTPVPLFIFLNFRPDVPDRYLPMEEIVDHGYAVATIYYQDVTTDDDQKTGLAALYPSGQPDSWGKIGMWAFAASRVMDYALTRKEFDPARIAVVGHSRLGKTALWAGAQDERFSLAISNDSGCSGAAISRDKGGETVKFITGRFPYWFCPNYFAWAGREMEMPFDQHMLMALCAPRHLYVASALEDDWADPVSEFLGARAAGAAFSLHELPGLISPDQLPQAGEAFHEGCVGYHLRAGTHFLSRTDWLRFMEYRDRHGV